MNVYEELEKYAEYLSFAMFNRYCFCRKHLNLLTKLYERPVIRKYLVIIKTVRINLGYEKYKLFDVMKFIPVL